MSAPIPGIMWQWDHERILDFAEHEYWQYHILPRGWQIIAAPMSALDEGEK